MTSTSASPGRLFSDCVPDRDHAKAADGTAVISASRSVVAVLNVSWPMLMPIS